MRQNLSVFRFPPGRRTRSWRCMNYMSRMFGYARCVSSTDQDLAAQRASLATIGCAHIRESHSRSRTELAALMHLLRPGDTLVCTRIDHLAGTFRGLQEIVRELRGKTQAAEH